MLDFTQKIEELKISNNDLTNFRATFNQTQLALVGDLIDENGENIGTYGCGVLAYFYIPTNKGYVSSEWKKTKFWKMEGELLTDKLLIELEAFHQEKEETKFIRQTGISVASAIAEHMNRVGADPYCTA